MRRRWKRAILIAPFAFLGILLFMALGGGIVEYLWNWLVPSLFGLARITFWQALGLLVLCRILFGGMGGRGAGRWRSRPYRRMAERLEQMTPEERERLRHSWRGRRYCRASEEGEEEEEERRTECERPPSPV